MIPFNLLRRGETFNVDGAIVINGERLNNLRYADDTVIFVDTHL